MKLHHVGYLTKNIEKTLRMFGHVFGVPGGWNIIEDDIRQCRISFMEFDGYRMECIEPLKGSKIYPLLKKYRNTYYHICCETDDLTEEIERMREIGFIVTDEAKKAPALGEGKRAAFLLHPDMGIVELVGR